MWIMTQDKTEAVNSGNMNNLGFHYGGLEILASDNEAGYFLGRYETPEDAKNVFYRLMKQAQKGTKVFFMPSAVGEREKQLKKLAMLDGQICRFEQSK